VWSIVHNYNGFCRLDKYEIKGGCIERYCCFYTAKRLSFGCSFGTSVRLLTAYIVNDIINKTMKIKNLTKLFGSKFGQSAPLKTSKPDVYHYKPTPYLANAFLQSVYNISEPPFPFKFKREQIFFNDGGHISLDWLPPVTDNPNPPILFVMHGLTGGSEMNYIKELMRPAAEEGYCCVCLNSRGVNN
jgi:hypothetical protein